MQTISTILKSNKMNRLWKYFLTCLIVSLVLAPILDQKLENFWLTLFFGLFYSLSGLYVSIWLFQYLDKKYNWITHLWKRLIIGFVVLEIWSVFVFLIMTPPLLMIFYNAPYEDILSQLKSNVKYPLIMGGVGMVIIASVEFFKHWKKSYLKREELKAEMMTYKYEALHNQLNPHFLFNSFNVLSELVYEDEKLALKFIDQLSELYEKVLNGKQKELIPLQHEMDFVEAYIFLLKTRFENKLKIDINLEIKEDEWIAPMVLQLLIENAVKHNKISKSEPLHISIQKEGKSIIIKNDLCLKKTGDNFKGTGLQNIKQRYSFFTDEPIVITQTKSEFIVKVPVLIKKEQYESI